jgi:hypothetical protein
MKLEIFKQICVKLFCLIWNFWVVINGNMKDNFFYIA